MSDWIDTSAPFAVHRSPPKPCELVAVAAAIGLLCPDTALTQSGEAIAPVGWAGAMVFGGSAFILICMASRGRRPVAGLTSQDLIDRRRMTAPMPWNAGERIGECEICHRRSMTVTPSPEYAPDLRPKRLVRAAYGANAALGIDGVAMRATRTDKTADQLKGAIFAFAAAHAASSAPRPT